MADTLFHKVWNAHAVRTLPSGQTQLFVGLHLVHEVTTPQAFDMMRQHGWRDVLTSQCLALDPLKVRRIDVGGRLNRGVYAKDVILTIIRRLGVEGGVGYAYEYGGPTVEAMTIDERMTMCNMSIEGGARVGYVNPDEKTFAYVRGRRFAPTGDAFDRAVAWWRSIASDRDARYDDRVKFDASAIEPTVTWGI